MSIWRPWLLKQRKMANLWKLNTPQPQPQNAGEPLDYVTCVGRSLQPRSDTAENHRRVSSCKPRTQQVPNTTLQMMSETHVPSNDTLGPFRRTRVPFWRVVLLLLFILGCRRDTLSESDPNHWCPLQTLMINQCSPSTRGRPIVIQHW